MARVTAGWILSVGCGLFLCVPAAHGQTTDRQWEVEFHAGGLFSSAPDSGTGTLPRPSELTSFPSPLSARIVSSWYFGDGAEQLNAAMASFLLRTSITPLDDVLRSRLADYGSGGSFGARVSRQLNRRFGAEFTLEMSAVEATMTTRVLTGIESSRVSYAAAWNAFLRGPSGAMQRVDSIVTVDEDGGRPLIASGALTIDIRSGGRVMPYVAVGAGVVTARGEGASAELEGSYSFVFPPTVIPSPVPLPTVVVNDRDVVVVRSVMEKKGAFLFGGGIRYGLSERLGMRIDLRDYVSGNPQRTELSATPSTGPLSAALTLLGPPGITLGSSSFARPTLSGPPLADFVTFRGDGFVHRLNLGVGLYWRF